MKIIQTFWAGKDNTTAPLGIHAGWLSPEYHWMSWALSSNRLNALYKNVELFTDNIGKKILVDELKLPYSKVHIVFDTSFNIPPKIFSLSKIKTYSLQNEPFIHVDGDLFLWKPISKSILSSEVIASNIEQNLFFNEDIINEVKQNFNKLPNHILEIKGKNIYSTNAGIFGGNNLDFIKKYCEFAFKTINENSEQLQKVNTGALNWLIEQISLYYLAKAEKVKISYVVSKKVTNPLYEDYWCFADIPNVKMVHPVGGCKKESYVLEHLAKRLRLEFPDSYFRVLELCEKNDIKTEIVNYGKSGTLIFYPKKYEFEFKESYRRTLKLIECIYGVAINDFGSLEKLLVKRKLKKQVYDIFNIEKTKDGLCKIVSKSIISDNMYEADAKNYKDASELFFKPNWINAQIEANSLIHIQEVGWYWKNPFNLEDYTLDIDHIIKAPEQKFTLALVPDMLKSKVKEFYLDTLDAAILNYIQKSTSVNLLLIHLLQFFEDEIDPSNKVYQKLIFDNVKRLAFEGLIRID